MKNIKPCWKAFSKQELALEVAKGFFLWYMISYLFYNRFWLLILYLLLWYPWICFRESCKEKKQKEKNLEQLKEMLISIHNSLYAGYSLENAMDLARKDLHSCFGSVPGGLEMYLDKVMVGLGMNQPIEGLLKEMEQEICLEEMTQFVKVILIVKKRGGNLVEILGETIDHLNQKIQVKEEIITLTSAKVLEQRIMSVMPFFILCYVRFTNPNYFDVLYSTLAGCIVSTVALLVLGAAYMLGTKIIEIEV